MWVVAVLSDGPLQGQRIEIEATAAKPPGRLELTYDGDFVYVYTLGGASSKARRWNYRYLSRTEIDAVAIESSA